MTNAKGDGPAKEPGFPLSGEVIDGFAGLSVALGRILRVGEATNIVAAYEREDKRAIEWMQRGRASPVADHLLLSPFWERSINSRAELSTFSSESGVCA